MSNFYHNRWKLLFSNIGNDATFTLGVYFIFMLFLKLSISQISFILSIQLIIISIGVVPGGLFADRYGYKKALLYGSILFLLGTVLFAFAKNFYSVLVGFSFIATGIALKQGTQYAFLYAGLSEEGNVTDYKRIAGKIDLYTNIFWVFASIIGGILYSLAPRLPFYAEIVVALISLISISFLQEPTIQKHKSSVLNKLKNVLKVSFTKPKFSKIFVFSALIGSIALITIQYTQPLYKLLNIPTQYFGIIAAVFFIMRGLGSWYSNQLGKFFSVDKYLVLHAATFGMFLVLIQKLNSELLILPILGGLYFLRGLYNPTISTYINDRVDSSERATILSVNNQLLTLVTSLALIVTGIIGKIYNLATVFFAISILSLIFLILYVITLRKVDSG